MNEHGHRLGSYIEPDTTERHYRQRLRTGNIGNPTEFQTRHREARQRGKFFDLDQTPATGLAIPYGATTLHSEITTAESTTITTQKQNEVERIPRDNDT